MINDHHMMITVDDVYISLQLIKDYVSDPVVKHMDWIAPKPYDARRVFCCRRLCR
jgi:hypothetical protein